MDRLWVLITITIVLLYAITMFITELGVQFNHVVLQGGNLSQTEELCESEEDQVINLMLLASVVVAVITGIFLSRLLSAPISALADSAQIIGQGNLNARIKVRGSREIRDVATAFNQMAADLQHSRELRDQLMADVSHELRTPLTVLAGNLRAALDHVYTLDEAEIANLYGQTNHLIRLVNDLHELGQAAAHQLPLDRQPTNMAQLLCEVCQTFEALATERAIGLECHIDGHLPLISVDVARIRQVLHNLLSNALRHTPTGGRITLTAEANEQELLVTVTDTGQGIAPEHIAKVFERFYRADPSRSRATGSTGLGLAIVKAIVEAHHGHVSVYSAGIGQGTSFKIWLPVRSKNLDHERNELVQSGIAG